MKNYQKYINTDEIYLFNIGEAQQAYATFGCHPVEKLGMHRFLVWAPNAQYVSVVGDFNGWDASKNRMEKLDTGVFAAFIPGLQDGDCYKYSIQGYDGKTVLKADPFAFHAEVRPATASKVWSLGGYSWRDADFLRRRLSQNVLKQPVAIYEMHMDRGASVKGIALRICAMWPTNFPNTLSKLALRMWKSCPLRNTRWTIPGGIR